MPLFFLFFNSKEFTICFLSSQLMLYRWISSSVVGNSKSLRMVAFVTYQGASSIDPSALDRNHCKISITGKSFVICIPQVNTGVRISLQILNLS